MFTYGGFFPSALVQQPKLVLMADGASTKRPQRPPAAAAMPLDILKTWRVVFIF